MIYLDNSATTHKKPKQVIKAVKTSLTKYNFNLGRSGYKPATDAHLKQVELRYSLKDMFNAKSINNVIITKNCTESINLALNSMAIKDGHIIVSVYEHNSVLRTLYELKKSKNITFSVAKPNKFGQIETASIKKLIRKNTFLVVINHTSNVTGDTQDIKQIGKFCHKNKLLFLVDAAQSAGHTEIDMQKCNINALALAGHKGLMGPFGIGVLIIDKIKLHPLIFGGTGSNSLLLKQPQTLPDGFESGTQNIQAIMGLLAGVKFVKENQEKINKKIELLSKILLENLKNFNLIQLYSKNAKSGVISFAVKGMHSSEVCNLLYEKYKICARCGLHCAPLIHKYLKTQNSGLVRISLCYYNTKKEIKVLISALFKIAKNEALNV